MEKNAKRNNCFKSNRKRGKMEKFRKKNVEEQKHMQAKLHARYGSTKRQNDVLIATINPLTMEVTHPTSYERQMSRALEAHLHRLAQPEIPEDLIPSVWLCALCQNRSCFDSLGDLYGPYFMELSDELCRPRAFIMSTILDESLQEKFPLKKNCSKTKLFSTKTNQRENLAVKGLTDLWFHGKCALWAPELFLIGGKFFGMEKFLKKFWSQECKICSKMGATISIQNKYFLHYPCANEKGYRFKELTFICLEPLDTPTTN